MTRLYTFDISHFSEKARWALDYEGIDYDEKILIPGPHLFVTRRIAPKSTVPILEHGGQYVQGSTAILDYVATRLGGMKLAPRGDHALGVALDLEARVDHAFGLGAQRVLYSVLLRDRKAVTALWSARGPAWARMFYVLAYPGVATAVKRMYRTADAAAVAQAQRVFVETFDDLDRILERQPYLGGDGPSRSDITVAALLAPICRPPEHRVKWPEVPSDLAGFAAQLDGRPTWRHVLGMYREHRHAPARRTA
jgi:glutathione S-transferase